MLIFCQYEKLIFHFIRKGVIGSDCMDIFAPDDHELITSSIAKVTEGAKIELSDMQLGHNDSRNHIANL